MWSSIEQYKKTGTYIIKMSNEFQLDARVCNILKLLMQNLVFSILNFIGFSSHSSCMFYAIDKKQKLSLRFAFFSSLIFIWLHVLTSVYLHTVGISIICPDFEIVFASNNSHECIMKSIWNVELMADGYRHQQRYLRSTPPPSNHQFSSSSDAEKVKVKANE